MICLAVALAVLRAFPAIEASLSVVCLVVEAAFGAGLFAAFDAGFGTAFVAAVCAGAETFLGAAFAAELFVAAFGADLVGFAIVIPSLYANAIYA